MIYELSRMSQCYIIPDIRDNVTDENLFSFLLKEKLKNLSL